MKQKRGFSLIETMIAVGALSFTVLVFGAVFPAGSRLRQKGEWVTRATVLAEQRLEEVRSVGYSGLNYTSLAAAGCVDSSATNSPYSITNAGVATALPSGTGTLTITYPSTDLAQAQVTINWGGILNGAKTVTLTTYIANLADKTR